MKSIRIALADDQKVFRKEIASLMNNMPGVEVVIEAADGNELLEKLAAQEEEPNVIILDLNMPGLSGVETMPLLKKQYPNIKVMVLSLYNDENFVAYLTEIGADSYLFKDSDPQTIHHAIYELVSSS
jgi:DNA-binding NarL/FixJ family response regulator